MSKIWLIIKHEYLSNIRRRSFLFGAFGAPIISVLLMTLVFGVVMDSETDIDRVGLVGYVDNSGVLAQQVGEPENFRPYETEEAARADLDADTLGAYFVLPANYMATGIVNLYSKTSVPDALDDSIDEYLRANLSIGLPPEISERMRDPLETSIRTLDNGRELRSNAVVGLILVPTVFVVVFLFASQTTSGYLMGSVVEEKTTRIVEILVTSVTPFQLLFGKIIGLGLLGLTQLVVWLVFGVVGLRLGNNIAFLEGITIPTDLLVVSVIYFLLGYFLLASVMAGIGVVTGSEQESRQYASIFSLIMVIPIFLIVSFISDPEGPVVIFLSLFPLTSPVAVILRMGFGAVPTEQLLLSMALLAFTALFSAWAASRIFRWGLLLYGKRPSPRELLRVMRRPPSMATSVSGEHTS